MIQEIATSTEIKNNFGKYLNMIMNGNEVIITKNGKEVGRIIPKDHATEYLTDSLTGVINGKYDLKEERMKRLKDRYESVD